MTKSQDLREYRRVITTIFEAGPIDISASDDVYDRYLTDFLRQIKTSASPDKLKWMLLRVGLRTEINAMHSQARAALKAEDPYEVEKVERKRQQGADTRASKNWKKEYCAEHRIPVEGFHDHFMKRNHEDHVKRMSDFANARAARILASWLCDGVPLSQITGADLDRLITKEDAAAHGHLANAMFYRGLREHTPDGKTVGASVAAEDLVRAFNSSFKEKVFAWDGAYGTAEAPA
jgi:hypothetical protein